MYNRGFVPVIAIFLAAGAILGGAYYISHDGKKNNQDVDVNSGVSTATATIPTSTTTIAATPSPTSGNRSEVRLPNTGTNITTANQARTTNQAATPINSEVFYQSTNGQSIAPVSTGAFNIFLISDGTMWKEGGTYSIEWSPKNTVTARRFNDFKVELIEPQRIDRGPIIIASYSDRTLAEIPRTINFTLPTSLSENVWYAIKITYKTSNENYLGEQGFKGVAYTGTSPSFKITSSDGVTTNTQIGDTSEAVLRATSLNFTQPSTIVEKQTNVPFLRFRLAASGDDVTVTHFALGSPTGNDIFNYVENVKLQVNGELINLQFSNEYLLGTTLWKLDRPITINENGSITATIVADIKPGIKDTELRASLKGGRANTLFNATLHGPTVEVD